LILLVGLWRAASAFNLDQVAALIGSANALALAGALAAALATLLLRGLRGHSPSRSMLQLDQG
ncbi:MAG: hypothetical protein ACKN9G_01425, partial [Candidatus Limnocylindrus sp.]